MALAALALAAAPAAHAAGGSVEAAAGVVRARLSYQSVSEQAGQKAYAGLELRITRGATAVYDRPVGSNYCPSTCIPEGLGGEPAVGPPVAVDELEGTGEPAVVLDLYTGAEHCCHVVQVLSYEPATGSYALVERNLGDAAGQVVDVAGDRRLEIESADDRFAYAFSSYAFSGLPLQIWRIQGGRFVDATRSFPRALAADATSQWSRYLANRRRGLGLGFLAAWTADEVLLGRRAQAERRLRTEAQRGRLRSGDRLSPSGGAFIRKLNRFLAANGYR